MSPSTDPTDAVIDAHPILRSATAAERGVITRNTTRIRVQRGAHLTRQDGLGTEVVFVLSGEGEVVVDDQIVGALGPGDVCGEVAVLGDARRTATVRATTDLDVLVASSSELAAILVERPDVSRRLLHELAAHRDRDKASE